MSKQKLSRLGLMAGVLWSASPVQALTLEQPDSGLFAGEHTSFWLFDSDTGQVTSYSTGRWLDSWSPQGTPVYDAPAGSQILVNRLPNSSTAMTAKQPQISLIGLTPAEQQSGSDTGPQLLSIAPASGQFTTTTAVQLQASASLDGQQPLILSWRISRDQVAGDWQQRTLSQVEQEDGYFQHPVYLVRDGAYYLEVLLRQGSTTVATASAQYTLVSSDDSGMRRDSDDDGIPDLVELEIGLDPLTGDLDQDSNGDGWSDFDTWLRCDGDVCTAPKDSDGDGWSDFDEILRGTAPDDPMPVLADMEVDSQSYRDTVRRYQEFPAARRLYEPEYRLRGAMGDELLSGPMADSTVTLEAAALNGEAGWQMTSLLTQDDLERASLNHDKVAASRLVANAETALAKQQWPALRLPAADGVVYRLTRTDAQSGSQSVNMLWQAPVGDVSAQAFAADAGDWSSAAQWKAAFIDWLKPRLVLDRQDAIGKPQSLALLALEQVLRQEARLRNENATLRLGQVDASARWLSRLQPWLQQRYPAYNLEQLVPALTKALTEGGVLADDGVQLRSWLETLPEGQNSSVWLKEKLAFSRAGDTLGCQVSDAEWQQVSADADLLAEFRKRCPQHYTDSELAQWQQQDASRRYRLRLVLTEAGFSQLPTRSTLSNGHEDSDGDGLSNELELQQPLERVTLPWRADTDGDQRNDRVDACPLDRWNGCDGSPQAPTLMVQQSDIHAARPSSDSTLLLALELDRPATSPVRVQYQLEPDEGDVWWDGDPLVVEAWFEVGQQVLLVPITVPGVEPSADPVSVNLSVTSVDGAILGDETQTLVKLDPDTSVLPVAVASASQQTLNERSSLTLDGAGSFDPSGLDLSYQWQQRGGPAVALDNMDLAQLTFNVPEVLVADDLAFRLTVTNGAGRQDQTDVTVRILPLEDAPEQLSIPEFALLPGDQLTLPDATLSSYLREPDGDPLTFGVATGLPDGITARHDANGLHVRANAGEQSLQARYSRDLRPFGDTGVAWLTMPGQAQLPFGIWSWEPGQQQPRSIITLTGNDSISSLRGWDGHDRLVFDIYDTAASSSRLYWYDDKNGLDNMLLSSFGDLSGVHLHAGSGNLYQCDYDGVWKLLDLGQKTSTSTTFNCDYYQTDSLTMGDRTCLSGSSAVTCSGTGTDQNLTAVYTLSSSTVGAPRLFEVQGQLIMWMEEYESTDGIYQQYGNLLQVSLTGAEPVALGRIPIASMANVYQVGDQLLMLLNDSNAFQLYQWQPGQDGLKQLSADLFADVSLQTIYINESLSQIVNGELVLLASDNNQSQLLSISTEGVVTVRDNSGRRLSAFQPWQNGLLVAEDTGSNEGLCHWRLASESVNLIENSSCFGSLVRHEQLLFQRPDKLGETSYYRFDGVAPTGTNRIQIPVDDGKGNGIDMSVDLRSSIPEA